MLRPKRRQAEIITLLDGLREELDERRIDRDSFRRLLRETQGKAAESRQILADRLAELEERVSVGMQERGSIRLAAYLLSGMLSVVVEDDGRGVDIERLRRKVVERKLVTEEMAVNLSEAELMEYLYLPSFSTKEQVTEISGRGVGLDVVHDVVQEMRGMVRATSQFGTGTRNQLQLPLTLSVLPA